PRATRTVPRGAVCRLGLTGRLANAPPSRRRSSWSCFGRTSAFLRPAISRRVLTHEAGCSSEQRPGSAGALDWPYWLLPQQATVPSVRTPTCERHRRRRSGTCPPAEWYAPPALAPALRVVCTQRVVDRAGMPIPRAHVRPLVVREQPDARL